MHIRIASEADIAEMHRIRTRVRENRLLDAAAVQPEDYRSFLNERGCGWVAEIDGQIIGFAIADLARANIWVLFVAPEAEERGVGRALHDRMILWLFSAGAERIWLSTDAATRAERFYKAAGWQYAGDARGEARYELTRSGWSAGERDAPLRQEVRHATRPAARDLV